MTSTTSSTLSLQTTLTLNDGTKIPQLGFGTFEYARLFREIKNIKNQELTKEEIEQHKSEENKFSTAVRSAIESGYRHIDSAQVYGTETIIGNTLQEVYKNNKNITRKDIWITTKFSMMANEASKVPEVVNTSLKGLQTDYIDLYLIHSPHSHLKDDQYGKDVVEAYKHLLAAKKEGKIRSVGVSNFSVQHLETLKTLGLAAPSINQIELHPFYINDDVIEYCQKENIAIEAYSPIARADEKAQKSDILLNLAKKYNVSWSQIMLRWSLQRGFIPLPKSVTPKRITSNCNLYTFTLTKDEVDSVNTLKKAHMRKCFKQGNPLEIKWGDCKNWKF